MKHTPSRSDIPCGAKNALSRRDLARLWGCSDREARRQIAEFRAAPVEDGSVILSSSSAPSGYWRSSNPAEIRRFVQETESRAKSTFGALKGARHALRQLEAAGQENFFKEGQNADRSR